MAMDIKSGAMTTYDGQHSVQPLDASATPGVQQPTAADGLLTPADQGAVMPTTAMFAEQAAAGEADCSAAMNAAMGAEDGRRAGYQAQALPLGGHIGEAPVIPPVPDNANPPAQSDLYPYAGEEPTPTWAGFFHGNEPGP